VSINQVRGPERGSNGNVQSLEIEMQTGDVLRIEAGEFSIQPADNQRAR